MMSDFVTANFTIGEFVLSQTAVRLGINNQPPALVEANLRNVLIPAMQAVRDALDHPIFISSGYRSPRLNAAVHGSPGSDHLTGHAADFTCPGFGSPLTVCRRLLALQDRLKWDQLIFEGAWVHVSFSPRRRNEVLTAHFTDAGVRYTQGLPA